MYIRFVFHVAHSLLLISVTFVNINVCFVWMPCFLITIEWYHFHFVRQKFLYYNNDDRIILKEFQTPFGKYVLYFWFIIICYGNWKDKENVVGNGLCISKFK